MIREPGPNKGCHYISHIQEPDFIIGLQLISPCLSIAYCLWEILPSLNPISAETSHAHGTISMCPSYISKLYIFSRECRGTQSSCRGWVSHFIPLLLVCCRRQHESNTWIVCKLYIFRRSCCLLYKTARQELIYFEPITDWF
jgi:hypothetical protein